MSLKEALGIDLPIIQAPMAGGAYQNSLIRCFCVKIIIFGTAAELNNC